MNRIRYSAPGPWPGEAVFIIFPERLDYAKIAKMVTYVVRSRVRLANIPQKKLYGIFAGVNDLIISALTISNMYEQRSSPSQRTQFG